VKHVFIFANVSIFKSMDTTKDWQFGKTLPDRINYMLQNELMCDVTFHVGANRTPIKAHKFMLASASPVFYNSKDENILGSTIMA
jgi:hypothetical protein